MFVDSCRPSVTDFFQLLKKYFDRLSKKNKQESERATDARQGGALELEAGASEEAIRSVREQVVAPLLQLQSMVVICSYNSEF